MEGGDWAVIHRAVSYTLHIRRNLICHQMKMDEVFDQGYISAALLRFFFFFFIIILFPLLSSSIVQKVSSDSEKEFQECAKECWFSRHEMHWPWASSLNPPHKADLSDSCRSVLSLALQLSHLSHDITAFQATGITKTSVHPISYQQ